MRFIFTILMVTAIGQASETSKAGKQTKASLESVITQSQDLSHKTFYMPCLNSDTNICAQNAKKIFSSKIYFDKQNKMNVFSCQVDPDSQVSCSETTPVENKFAFRPSIPTVSCQVVSSNCVLPTYEKIVQTKVIRTKCSKGFKGLYSRVEQAVSNPNDYRDILVACISEDSYQAQVGNRIPKLAME